jgi:general secretion pathway protein G
MERHRSRKTPLQKGFTLIELLVVIVILSILAAFVIPRVMDQPDKARVTKARQDVSGLVTALNIYRLDNFAYPATAQGLDALVQQPTGLPAAPNWKTGGYIDRLPVDPWGNPYQYLNPGLHGEIDVYSLGADGAAGGEGLNADIGNWTD